MTTIGIIFTVLGGLILLPFLLHFALIPIVGKYIDKKKEEYKYWNNRVYKGDRFQIFLTKSRDLMLAFHHYYNELNYDDDKRTYAKELVVHFGGFHIFWKYGHEFLDPTKWSEDSKTKYYGLYCIDGWHGGWDNIWWGTHIYDLPWRRCRHSGTFIWDKNKNQLLNQYELKEAPLFKVMKNTIYINKIGNAQLVPKIEWTLVERNWESPMLRWIGIAKWVKKKIVYLEFDCSNDGNKDFNGIGVIKNEWKGGTYGSAIRIEKNSEPEIWKLYKSVVIRKNERRLQRFKNILENRITRFMLTDGQY